MYPETPAPNPLHHHVCIILFDSPIMTYHSSEPCDRAMLVQYLTGILWGCILKGYVDDQVHSMLIDKGEREGVCGCVHVCAPVRCVILCDYKLKELEEFEYSLSVE